MSENKLNPTELARDFYYLSQFGFTKAPVTVGGGEEKLRRFASALCNISGADGEVSEDESTFIMGYLASKGYPQSILDDIPGMCRAAETKTRDDVFMETKELLAFGSLKKAARQIIYDGIRAAARDGLDEKEKLAINGIAKELGVGEVELSKIYDLVQQENDLRDNRIKLLFPEGHPCLP
mmetsp:Transcript_5979/g.10910  ORF Transcript_5979/g.10910 Transcript_5979/m.10910 type:complete len:180 (+) Transcript_5979:211-750(+)|eukprot:CAMPEP_0201598452 /NCGR_PEP_ID=MMETSP0492-20130828/251_1 /ASSEMBLY_ACC=CAM_ASM_000837 /TAXON_ID=420259 /ORGANISM="Thalassiosira gravida, Strain GMp14c1" /LENGTH=179 /DNA_ID=CAMNT_0048060861 /DNA_START=67 /DNA_END=606 /DNA_ORIENTATION=-